jgi:hypothetical protein
MAGLTRLDIDILCANWYLQDDLPTYLPHTSQDLYYIVTMLDDVTAYLVYMSL